MGVRDNAAVLAKLVAKPGLLIQRACLAIVIIWHEALSFRVMPASFEDQTKRPEALGPGPLLPGWLSQLANDSR